MAAAPTQYENGALGGIKIYPSACWCCEKMLIISRLAHPSHQKKLVSMQHARKDEIFLPSESSKGECFI
jgi:hypothetical protein